jgi:hypothetical protein
MDHLQVPKFMGWGLANLGIEVCQSTNNFIVEDWNEEGEESDRGNMKERGSCRMSTLEKRDRRKTRKERKTFFVCIDFAKFRNRFKQFSKQANITVAIPLRWREKARGFRL